MFLILLLLSALPLSEARAQPRLSDLLARVAEEADGLQQNLPKALSRETLEQRALLPPSRFHPRAGSGASQAIAPRALIREVVSEYTVGTLKDSGSQNLVEYRQVIAVDGRPVQGEAKARHALSLGIKSLDDRLRKRMLEDFAKYGLVDIATDYGLILLLFTRRGQPELEMSTAGAAQLGPDTALVIHWRQTSAAHGALEFIGRQALRHALEGRLWVRASDGLPLRVESWIEHLQEEHKIRDEATVEYAITSRGFLAPASVVHRHIVDARLLTENRYRYEPFQVFSSDVEIKFEQAPQ
ncbi:MAG: hypothetical protein C5B51_08125 [Terriglobia bacterium]|nr:MAG: hypothetical protein C5B51_08125 [Terriglobia bacterium]